MKRPGLVRPINMALSVCVFKHFWLEVHNVVIEELHNAGFSFTF